ncbi:MAG: hypothetical protein RSE24_01075 [Oscillospiraceae bacterium]
MVSVNGVNIEYKTDMELMTAIEKFIASPEGEIFKTEHYFVVLNDKFLSDDYLKDIVLKDNSVIKVYPLTEGG